jgi:hypothetical protein
MRDDRQGQIGTVPRRGELSAGYQTLVRQRNDAVAERNIAIRERDAAVRVRDDALMQGAVKRSHSGPRCGNFWLTIVPGASSGMGVAKDKCV